MTPKEFFNKYNVQFTSSDVHMIFSIGSDHFYEIPSIYDLNTELFKEKNTKISIDFYKNHSYDGRRIWRLAVVVFDNKKVMFVQNAGREGDDHSERFILNREAYLEMVDYLKSFEYKDDNSDIKEWGMEENIGGLTSFYSQDLDDEFRKWE